MIRQCAAHEFEQIYKIINDGALAYKGVIPEDCWTEPYMPRHELRDEIEAGVEFWGWEHDGALRGVMGLQNVPDVVLIRHAYVLPNEQRRGIGAGLLSHLRGRASAPILIGTWADALWAICFYEKSGFRLVGRHQKDALLRRYWKVPPRQMEASAVLADQGWWDLNVKGGAFVDPTSNCVVIRHAVPDEKSSRCAISNIGLASGSRAAAGGWRGLRRVGDRRIMLLVT